MDYQMILASGSPRRKELLRCLCSEFSIVPSKKEEIVHSDIPSEVVLELSDLKAEDIASQSGNNSLIIGADTIVAYGSRILGKPKNEQDAVNMLTILSGHGHEVYTGVTLILKCKDGSVRKKSFYEKTDVYVSEMSSEEINDYVKTKEPMDKAGAYAIQGKFAPYIERISGDYYNVVGLPVSRLYREIKNW